jgi:SAM-dependent methyltransferase/uncharacterized protein YbaR (Trm112 family)
LNSQVFEHIGPGCPACGTGRLGVRQELRAEGGEIVEGLIECHNSGCRHLYPIIDGIPILVRDLRRTVSEQVLGIMARTDLSETLLGLVGECCGPASSFDSLRQHISTYGFSHWGDLDPLEALNGAAGRSATQILDKGLDRVAASGPIVGPVLDLGCSVGRTTIRLAQRLGPGAAPVVGVDLNFAMLRVAREAAINGRVSYARRAGGLVYERREFSVPAVTAGGIEFWCADALSLPFQPGSFGLVVSLNLLDCVAAPRDHLASIHDLLRPGGRALLATPFDWSAAATAPEAWIGGHSPYDAHQGRGERVIRSLLSGEHPGSISGLRLVDEIDRLPWMVRLHDRSSVHYETDLFVLAREGGASEHELMRKDAGALTSG